MRKLFLSLVAFLAFLAGGNTAAFAQAYLANSAVGLTQAYTATGTIEARYMQGNFITNTGAAGAIVLTLPDCEDVRLQATFFLTVAQDVDVNPADAVDQIIVETDAAGDAISSAAAIGNAITLTCAANDVWYPTFTSGVWADAN